MFICYSCGREDQNSQAKFCVDCGSGWTAAEVDRPNALNHYTQFFTEIFFEHSIEEAEALAYKTRQKLKVSAQAHRTLLYALVEQKKSVEHLSQFTLEFDENVIDAYAGHDTFLKFRFTNVSDVSEGTLLKVTLEWDDPETCDDDDLKIVSKRFIAPNCTVVLGGTHVFNRIGMKQISDLIVTISDQFQQTAKFRASPFFFKVLNSDQRVTQHFATHNTISIEGRGVIDNSGRGPDHHNSSLILSTEPGWIELSCVYLHTSTNLKDADAEAFDPDDLQSIKAAADSGNRVAIYTLAAKYETGKMVDQDYARAFELYMKAAHHNHIESMTRVGAAYFYGRGVDESKTTAVEWWIKASGLGDAIAQQALGVCYMNGDGIEVNLDKGIEFLQKSADQGLSEALYNLGHYYWTGTGVPMDLTRARRYFESAAEKGYVHALTCLGDMYDDDEGVLKNTKVAVDFYRRAADQGDGDGQYNLAWHYFHGHGVPRDYDTALEVALKAAQSGDSRAQSLVGKIYSSNDFAGKNIAKAIHWFRCAVAGGDEESQEALEALYCDSPAMKQCLWQIGRTCEALDDLADVDDEDVRENHATDGELLSPDLRKAVTDRILELTGWEIGRFVLYLQEWDSLELDDDDYFSTGFDGDAIVICAHGLVSVCSMDAAISCPG
jgi:TPR repeat protein